MQAFIHSFALIVQCSNFAFHVSTKKKNAEQESCTKIPQLFENDVIYCSYILWSSDVKNAFCEASLYTHTHTFVYRFHEYPMKLINKFE